jgi:hypothetical protein
MPIDDHILFLIPRAADIAYGNVVTREYPITLYVKGQSHFYAVKLLHIHYTPAWAKMIARVYESGTMVQEYAGSDGMIEIDFEVSNMESKMFALENLSIDAEVRCTLHFRGWQYGE